MRPPISPFSPFLEASYDAYPRIELAFQTALDESLHPRGPESLYEIVGKLGLRPGANALDLGCGEGRQSIKLAEDFGFAVQGIDPVPRHIELATKARDEAAKANPALSTLVRFALGSAGALPVPDASIDLIWCREVLVLVEALDEAFVECRRVLRGGGRMLIFQFFTTDRLEGRGVGWHAHHVEGAFTAAGFRIDECIDMAGEWGERAQEERGEPGRRLLHAARLLREPDRYIAQFGRANYDIMLADCLWHVYRMIGKLTGRMYLLRLRETPAVSSAQP